MFCWPWKHDWKFIDIHSHDYDNRSHVLYYCTKCGKFKTNTLGGEWCVKHKYKMEERDGEKIIHLHERN